MTLDADFLARLKQRDPATCAWFIFTFTPILEAMLRYKLRDHTAIEDVRNATFCRVFELVDGFTNLQTFLQGKVSTYTFAPVSTPAQSIFDLSVLVLTVTSTIFVVVFSLLAYAAIKFRTRRAEEGLEPVQTLFIRRAVQVLGGLDALPPGNGGLRKVAGNAAIFIPIGDRASFRAGPKARCRWDT